MFHLRLDSFVKSPLNVAFFSIMNFKNNDVQFGVNLKDFDCLMLSIVARMRQFLS